MSTAPVLVDPKLEVGQAGRSQDGGQAPAQDQRAPPAPHAERRQEKRFFRIARVADTVIGVVALLGGFLAATIDRMPAGLQEFLEMRLTVRNLLLVVGYTAVWRVICVLSRLYDENRVGKKRVEALRVFAATTAGAVVALIFPIISVSRAFRPLAVVFFWIGSTAGMLLVRAVLRSLLSSRSTKTQDVLIVGSGPRALSLYYGLCGARANGFRVLGFVDSCNGDVAPEVQRRLLGDLAGLEQILMRQAIDEVLIALPVRSHYAEIQRTIEICERGGVPARYLADVFHCQRNGKHQLAAEPVIPIPASVSPDDGGLLVKRCLDIALGGLALTSVLPVLAVAALAIKLTSRGPVLFMQERYGLNKRRFKMYKLRTMVAGAEAQQALLEARNEATGPVFKIRDDPRLTRVGRVLRRFSIDELPQLVNVLRGDMSLVGPRPLPLRDVSLFSEPALMRRFCVYPGITGLWQVSGRSNVRFDDWMRLDLQYIDEWSLSLDLEILAKTLPVVLKGTGAS